MRSIVCGSVMMLLLVMACGSENNSNETAMMDAVFDAVAPPPPPMTKRAGVAQVEDATIERKIINSGELRFQSRDLAETEKLILDVVGELGGYISNNNTYSSDDKISQNITVRVPADKFDNLLERVSENARKIDYRNIHSQDVTEEFIDIEARLRTKKELENRYLELLKKATKVEEIVAIEKEIGTLRSEIESIEGRLKYLNSQVNMSTLTIDFYQMTGSTLNFSSTLGNAIVSGWRLLLAFLVGLVNLWPFLLIITVTLFVLFRFRRKRRRSA